MLNIIGLGLADKKDITLKGLEVIRRADEVFMDGYTSLMLEEDIEGMEKLYGKKIEILYREEIEKDDNRIIKDATNNDVCLLVVGDGLAATTHIDLIIRAEKSGIKTRVIHNASIMTAIGITGLSLYKFGQTCSLVFPEEGINISAYEAIERNKSIGLHTLVLLDIKRNELSLEGLRRNIDERETRFMSANQAIEILLSVEEKEGRNVFKEDSLCIGAARIGSDNPKIVFGKAKDVKKAELGKVPHCLIIPSKMHFIEEEAVNRFRI